MFHIFQNDALVFIIIVGSLPKKLKYQSHNAQNRGAGEMANCIFKIYKKSVMPYERHIYQTSSDMAMPFFISTVPTCISIL